MASHSVDKEVERKAGGGTPTSNRAEHALPEVRHLRGSNYSLRDTDGSTRAWVCPATRSAQRHVITGTLGNLPPDSGGFRRFSADGPIWQEGLPRGHPRSNGQVPLWRSCYTASKSLSCVTATVTIVLPPSQRHRIFIPQLFILVHYINLSYSTLY